VAGKLDAKGKAFHDDLVNASRNSTGGGAGWVDYWWPKPGESEPSQKRTFAKAIDADGTPAALMSGYYVD
jgi:signal transduction histidine kinase